MPLANEERAKQIKRALAEMRTNRHLFSDESFGQVIVLLTQELRKIQTQSMPAVDQSQTDEIRLVTVMFVDVKDSTQLVETLKANDHDTADWKNIIGETHRRIATLVSSWDGQIGQYLGDGVLCFFGAQYSRGEDAISAVGCAQAIIKDVEIYGAEIEARYGVDFSVRIAISTGRVVVGLIGSAAKQELLALGPATNLAARLQSLADANEILVDSPTHARIRREYVTQPMPPATVKGFAEPVKYFRILEQRTQIASQFTDISVNGIHVPLIGRDEELATISYLIDKANNEAQCHSILLHGDVGLGKSRLLQETIHLMDGTLQYVGMTAHFEQRNRPYNLLHDMIMTQSQITIDMPPDKVRQQLINFLTDLAPDCDREACIDAFGSLVGISGFPQPNEQTLDHILHWFTLVAAQTPLLIGIDNLQWADGQSVQFLEMLSERLQHQPCILLVAARPDYIGIHPTYMDAHPFHTTIQLDLLNHDEIQALIQTVLGQVDRIPDYIDVAQILMERAEGNPLFAQEYLGNLFDQGVFQTTDNGRWRFNLLRADLIDESLPDGLVSILQARLDDLSSPARHVIQIASILGQVFWDTAISEIAGEFQMTELLDLLEQRGMIVHVEKSVFPEMQQYQFRHSLYREAAYEMMPRHQRMQYHQQMTNWLLTYIAGKHDYYALLAEQFLYSEQYGAALYTYLEAVQDRIRRELYTESLSLVDKSLGIASKVPRDEALHIVIQLWAYRGQTLITLGRYDEASAATQSALMLLEELPREALVNVRVMAQRVLGMAYTSLGRYNDAFDALSRAHNLLHSSASGQISAVLRAFGILQLYRGQLDDSQAYLRRAFNRAQTSEDQRIITEALSQMGVIDLERGRLADALDCFDQTVFLNQFKNFVVAEAADLRYLGMTYLALLQYKRAYECFNQALNLDTDIEHQNSLTEAYLALTMILMGRTSEGRLLLQDAFKRGHKDTYVQYQLHLVYVQGLAITEDFVNCREQSLALVEQLTDGNQLLRGRALSWLGYATMKLGNIDALHTLEEALALEMYYGGREVWYCHYLLALAHEKNTDWQQYHYRQAAKQLQHRAQVLENRHELYQNFMNRRLVQDILRRAGVPTEPTDDGTPKYS